MANMNFRLPAFGEHIGTSEQGIVICDGEELLLTLTDTNGRKDLYLIAPENAQQIAGALTTLSLKAMANRRKNKKDISNA